MKVTEAFAETICLFNKGIKEIARTLKEADDEIDREEAKKHRKDRSSSKN